MNAVEAFDRLTRARTLYDARRYDLAVTSALDAIALQPSSADAHVILSLSLDRLGRLAEADAAAKRAIELDPERAHAFVALGIVRLSQRRYAEALRQFREAAAIDPDDDDAFRLAAIAQMSQSHHADALTLIERAIAIDPHPIATREVHAMILRLLGRSAEAERETAHVLSVQPESVLGLSQRGFLQLERGDRGRALAAFREALRLDPNSESVRAGYERVVLKSTTYADWCGPQLFLLGCGFALFSWVTSGVSADLSLLFAIAGMTIWAVNRPIAVEALRRDEISRTFLTPAVLHYNRSALALAALALCSALLAMPLHRGGLSIVALGLLGAAFVAHRAMRPQLSAFARAFYAWFVPVPAILCVVLAAVPVPIRLDTDGVTQVAVGPVHDAELVAFGLAALVFVVADLCFVGPDLLRRIAARKQRMRG